MAMLAADISVDADLTRDVLVHLSAQLDSARRMQAIVLEQATAIRQRAIPAIVRLASALQSEMHRREVIEAERLKLLERASVKLGVSASDVSITMLAEFMDETCAEMTLDRTSELRRMLQEIQREHTTNRALMQQELAFLDHLLRLAGSAGGYDSAGEQTSSRRRGPLMHRPVFDLEA
jgi:flagellar biosynthesis/type III secretory pathway chaperone